MAKFNISIDTESKAVEATVNGKKISDVSRINVYCCRADKTSDYEHVECAVDSFSKDADGVRTYTTVVASEDETTKVQKDINSFFEKLK